MPLLLMWQESESEEYILDEGDDDDDLEEEHETQVHPEAETEVKKAPEVPAPPKEPERQLSKKELKQKEQAEFDALLADFGVAPNNGQENSQGEVALTASGGLRQLPGLTETFEIAALVCVHYDGLLDGKCLLGVIGGTRGKNKRSACTSARSDLRSWLKNNKTGSSCPSSLCDFMHG
ncbi:hypothetical protein F2Q68_00029015 [Brassica cretica]|uniref:Uncharacterized protein n=1 Tax=Brassica cretica TaxID=69181 RepID=A0A8S9G7Y5_BRACR|nr:hypothetical protein F2Q68_00029015 [Brassica cretica]